MNDIDARILDNMQRDALLLRAAANTLKSLSPSIFTVILPESVHIFVRELESAESKMLAEIERKQSNLTPHTS